MILCEKCHRKDIVKIPQRLDPSDNLPSANRQTQRGKAFAAVTFFDS